MAIGTAVVLVLGILALSAEPAAASDPISGAVIPGTSYNGLCNVTFHALDAGSLERGWFVDYACNGVVPTYDNFYNVALDYRVLDAAQIIYPHDGGSSIDWAPSYTSTHGGDCALAYGSHSGYAYSSSVMACPPPTNAARLVEGISNPVYGAEFSATEGSWTKWRAVQFRMRVRNVQWCQDGITPCNTFKSSPKTAEVCPGDCKYTSLPSLDNQTVLAINDVSGFTAAQFGFGGEASFTNATDGAAPPMPEPHFEGGSGDDAGECTLIGVTGPPKHGYTWTAGKPETFTLSYSGAADTITAEFSEQKDSQSAVERQELSFPATGSPMQFTITPKYTSDKSTLILGCIRGDHTYGWGRYDDLPDTISTGNGCTGGDFGLNPSSWVPAALTSMSCVLVTLFVPTDLSKDVSSIQDAASDRVPFSWISSVAAIGPVAASAFSASAACIDVGDGYMRWNPCQAGDGAIAGMGIVRGMFSLLIGLALGVRLLRAAPWAKNRDGGEPG